MKTPDIRGRVIEHVLERAYRAGVEDIHLIAALALHRRMTAGRAQARGRPADLRRVLSRPALQPRRRGPGRDRRARRDPPRRGGRALQARGRVGPAGLREHQHRDDGRRPQVGRDRPRHLQQRQGQPQRPHDAPLEVVHGPVEVRAAQQRRPPGRDRRGRRPDLPHRDDAQQRHVRRAARVPGQARGALDGARADDVRGLEAHDGPHEPEAAPGRVPQVRRRPTR